MRVGFVVKPLIKGFACISRMPLRSAPSAKSLILRLLTDFICPLRDYGCLLQYPACRFGERLRRVIGVRIAPRFWPFPDQDRATAGALTRLNVFPTVPHHEARNYIYLPICRRLKQESRVRLTACTSIVVIVITHSDVIHW